MTNVQSWGLRLLALAAVAGVSYWIGGRSSEAPKTPPAASAPAKGGGGPPPVAVDTAKVAQQPLPRTITAVGSLRSDEAVVVRPEVSGRIAEVQFREGERVLKGMVLIKLDQAVQRAEMQQAEANLALAKSRILRARDLHAKSFISSQALDESESSYRVALAAYELASARLTKLDIKAPFNGIAGLRLVSIGDYLKEGQDIVNLEGVDQLKVDFRIPEIYLKEVRPQQQLDVTLDALPGSTYRGQILAVNPLIDASGRAIVVRAVIRNTDARIRPGMFARVRLITDQQQDVLTIPEQALIPVGDEFFVYRIADNRAMRTKVDIGQRRTGIVEVTRGLGTTDIVVTGGQPKLRDGAPVKVTNLDGTAASAATDAAPRSAAAAEAAKPAR